MHISFSAPVPANTTNTQNLLGNSTSSNIDVQKVNKTELDIDDSSSSSSSHDDYGEKLLGESCSIPKEISHSAKVTQVSNVSTSPSNSFLLNTKHSEIANSLSLPKHENFLSMDESMDSNDESSVQNHSNYKRIRRSEALLTQAAKCVSKGQTFQTVSNMFNIPVSTIRFFMARKGILPKRKRGRSSGGSFGIMFKNN